MATAKQIAANRANAKRSTGPKTSLGKSCSRMNAIRHGLSLSVPQDKATLQKIDALALALGEWAAADLIPVVVTEMASAQVALMRIDKVRDELITAANGHDSTSALRRVAALDRYERYARTKRRRASEKLEALICDGISAPND